MTTNELKQMRRIFPKGWERSDIPAFIRKRDEKEVKGYFEQGEFDEDVSPEYREGQERLCQDAQDEAFAESNYIDRALEAGKEAGREMFN